MPLARGPYVPPRLWDPRQGLNRVNAQRLERITSLRSDTLIKTQRQKTRKICTLALIYQNRLFNNTLDPLYILN